MCLVLRVFKNMSLIICTPKPYTLNPCSRRGTMRSSNARRCWWQHVLPIAEGRTPADVALLQKPAFRGLNHPTVSPPVANCSRRELAGSNHETNLMVRPTFWITPIAQTSCQFVGSPIFSPGVEEWPPGSTAGENDHLVPHLIFINFETCEIEFLRFRAFFAVQFSCTKIFRKCLC
jgi:hypothetical protein